MLHIARCTVLLLFCAIQGWAFRPENLSIPSRPQEIQYALLVASYNNVALIEWNLDSALNQTFDPERYHIYYVNDHSTDGTLEKAKEYVKSKGATDRVTFIDNPERLGPLGSQYRAIHAFIPDNNVVVILDGDDALAHPDVLTILDSYYSYSETETWLTYGQFKEKCSGNIGFCLPYPPEVKCHCNYRRYVHSPSHLRTFYAWLFKKIRKEDLMYGNQFFPMTGDLAVMLPMLEMAQGHFQYISDILYIYNDQNPLSEHVINNTLQKRMDLYIRSLPCYRPLDLYERREFRKRHGIRRVPRV